MRSSLLTVAQRLCSTVPAKLNLRLLLPAPSRRSPLCCCYTLTDALARRLRRVGASLTQDTAEESDEDASGRGGGASSAQHFGRSPTAGVPGTGGGFGSPLPGINTSTFTQPGSAGSSSRRNSGSGGQAVSPLTPKRIPSSADDPVAAAILEAVRAPPRTPLRGGTPTTGGKSVATT